MSIVRELILDLAPLVFSVLIFRWFLRLSISTRNDYLVACFLSGSSFIVFQIIQSALVVGWEYVALGDQSNSLGDTFEHFFALVMFIGPSESWIQVANYLFPENTLMHRLSIIPPIIQTIYFMFYSLIGLVMIGGRKLWSFKLSGKILGAIVLGVVFLVYTLGLYFWMVTAMYL